MSAATNDPDCTQIQAMLPAYALGALEPDERLVVDHHLATCASCRAEVAALAQVVDSLGVAAPRETPPPGLKGRVLAAASDRAAAAPSSAMPDSEAVQAVGTAPPWWAGRMVKVLAAAAIILLIAVVVLSVMLARTMDERDDAIAAEEQFAAYFGPDGRAIAMTSLDGSVYGLSRGKGTLLTAPDEPMMVVVGGCPPSSDVRVYRVWTASEGDRTGVGTIEVDDQGNGYMLIEDPEDLGPYDQIGITMVTNGEQRNDMFVAQVQPGT
jgi:hypothetical protein